MFELDRKAEEEDVFPTMVSVLSDDEKDKMMADFDRFDEMVGGAEAHERYKRVVEELERELG